MTTIVVTITPTDTPLPAGATYASTAIVVTDNSGAVLPTQTVNGKETPPWTATFTGATGAAEASAVLTALDTNGNTLATLTLTESGTGGQPVGTFPSPTAGSITVT
jgi:hypothetical protein